VRLAVEGVTRILTEAGVGRCEDAVRYQIMASRYNPAHAALTMDLVPVQTLTGLPEATPVSFTCSPALTIRCRPS